MNGYSHWALETRMQLIKQSTTIPKPIFCRDFSNWLVSFSVVDLWASFPRAGYFLGLTGYRERNQRSKLQRGIWFGAWPDSQMSMFTRPQRVCLGCSWLESELSGPGLRQATTPGGLEKHRTAYFQIYCFICEPKTIPNQSSWEENSIYSQTVLGTLSPIPPTQSKCST